MSKYNATAPFDTNNDTFNGVYDSSSGQVVAVAAGSVSTDTNHNNQLSAPMQVQLVNPGAASNHVIIDANTIASYACSYVGLTPAASCTDLAILNGAANKVIRIMRIAVSALTSAGTGATLDLQLIKRSAANTGGTAVTNNTPIPLDSADGAAGAALTAYSANPAGLGAVVGTTGVVFAQKFQQTLGTPTVTDFPTNVPFIAQWGMTDSKPIVLRSAAEGLAINFNATSFAAGASVDITVEWTEAAA